MKTHTFVHRSRLPATASEAFRWHLRPGALERLVPPWEQVEVVRRSGTIESGGEVELRPRIGPLATRWVAKHTTFIPDREFRDEQIRGPFARWEHAHRFEPAEDDTCVLEDHVDYALPGGALGRMLGQSFVADKLQRMFRFRHDTTASDLTDHQRFAQQDRLCVAITGSTGLVGSQLTALLATGGHCVVRMRRGHVDRGSPSETAEKRNSTAAHDGPAPADEPAPSAEKSDLAEITARTWDPDSGAVHLGRRRADAVVHLAGESIAEGRWTEDKMARVRASRVESTRKLCESLAAMPSPPKTLVSASAVGFYGSRGDEWLDESSSAGEGFLAEVCRDWEAATEPARQAGIRVVLMRLGVVLTPAGGALAKMLTPFGLGLGGPIGSGRQYWSWISLDDAIGAIHHALMTPSLQGPVNLVAPEPVTNQTFSKTLARVLRRPAMMRVPKSAVRAALGQMADEMLLASARVKPCRLEQSGYPFRHEELEPALRHVLGC